MKHPINNLRISIAFITSLYLAFAAQTALSGLLASRDRNEGPVVISVLGKNEGKGLDFHGSLVLNALIVDGRLRKWEPADRSIGWDFKAVDNWLLAGLAYKQTSFPAVLNFSANRFVAVFQAANWSGTIRVTHNGRTIEREVQPNEGQASPIYVEDPPTRYPIALFVGALLLFTGCAWWLGPVRPGHQNILWLVFFLSVLHFLYWASDLIGMSPDSANYLKDFTNSFLAGFPAYFPPGYGALIAGVRSLPNQNLGTWLTAFQHAMVILGAVWVYRLLGRIISEDLALLGGILAGALPPLLTVPQAVLSETPTSFAMLGALYYAVRAKETGKMRFIGLSGLFAAWAVTLRMAPLIALLPAFCILYLSPVSAQNIRRLVATLAVLIAGLLPPLLWCWYHSGEPSLANSAGLHLYDRVVNEQKLLDEHGPATRTLTALLQGKSPTDLPCWEVMAQSGLRDLSYRDKVTLLRKVATEGVFKSPWRFPGYTLNLAWREFFVPTSSIPVWADTVNVFESFENPPLLPFSASALAWRERLLDVHRLLWPIVCVFALLSVLLGFMGHHRSVVLALACIPFGYLGASAAVEMFVPRYNAPVVPIVAALAIIPLDLLLTALSQPVGARTMFLSKSFNFVRSSPTPVS